MVFLYFSLSEFIKSLSQKFIYKFHVAIRFELECFPESEGLFSVKKI